MSKHLDDLYTEAKRIMALAYAPYSKFMVGAAIRTTGGQIFSGCNIENASYGLTLCAESNAISHMICAGEHDIQEVVIISSGDEPCAPCGACRQKIREFATSDTMIHMCNADGIAKSLNMEAVLPDSFGPSNLK